MVSKCYQSRLARRDRYTTTVYIFLITAGLFAFHSIQNSGVPRAQRANNDPIIISKQKRGRLMLK